MTDVGHGQHLVGDQWNSRLRRSVEGAVFSRVYSAVAEAESSGFRSTCVEGGASCRSSALLRNLCCCPTMDSSGASTVYLCCRIFSFVLFSLAHGASQIDVLIASSASQYCQANVGKYMSVAVVVAEVLARTMPRTVQRNTYRVRCAGVL